MRALTLQNKINAVRLVIMDVDGVLTDGRVIYDNYGDELKFFDATDGMGVVLLEKAGIPTVMLTSKKSKANARRAKELKMSAVYQGVNDKLKTFEAVIKRFSVRADQTCCVGDDLVDIPMLSRAGFAIAVPNAVPEVKGHAHYVTTKAGGRGAVREAAEKILKTQGKWEMVTREFRK